MTGFELIANLMDMIIIKLNQIEFFGISLVTLTIAMISASIIIGFIVRLVNK